jgi:hypothetical protein
MLAWKSGRRRRLDAPGHDRRLVVPARLLVNADDATKLLEAVDGLEIFAEALAAQRHTAARAARMQYIAELLLATLRSDDTEAEARDWLARLDELCSAHADDPHVSAWYDREQARLRRLIHP